MLKTICTSSLIAGGVVAIYAFLFSGKECVILEDRSLVADRTALSAQAHLFPNNDSESKAQFQNANQAWQAKTNLANEVAQVLQLQKELRNELLALRQQLSSDYSKVSQVNSKQNSLTRQTPLSTGKIEENYSIEEQELHFLELGDIVEEGLESDGEVMVEMAEIRQRMRAISPEQRMQIRIKIMQAINDGRASDNFYRKFF